MLLGDIVKQVSGVTYQKEQAITKPIIGYKPVLRAGNIFASRILEEDYVYVPEGLIRNDRLLKYGDILIAASSGSLSVVGKAAMLEADMDAGFGAFCRVLRPKTEIVYPRYLKFFFETSYYKNTIRHLAEGANINNLKSEHFHNLEIPLPPLAEQQKIAAILDAADSLRQKDQQLVERYTALSQSLFLEMFGDPVTNPMGWKKHKLDNCCSKISVGFVGICEPFYTDSTGVPMIRTGNLSDSGLKLSNLKYVTRKFHEMQKKSQLQAGDLLIARHGDNGKAVLYNGEFENANCLNIVILRGDLDLKGIYAQYFLNSESVRLMIQSRTGGATQKVINTKEIQKLEIPVPPITLQNQFAERTQLIEAQKQQAQRSLENSEALFNSLLQWAFTGVLTAKMAA